MDVSRSSANLQHLRNAIAAAFEANNNQQNTVQVIMDRSALNALGLAGNDEEYPLHPAEALALRVAIHVSEREAEDAARPETVSEQQLELLCPKFPYRKAVGVSQCGICLCEFKPNRRIRKLPCGHVFCSVCVTKWLVNESCTCPTCRFDVRNRAS